MYEKHAHNHICCRISFCRIIPILDVITDGQNTAQQSYNMLPAKSIYQTYTCHVCGETCTTRTNFYTHIKRHFRPNQVAGTCESSVTTGHDYTVGGPITAACLQTLKAKTNGTCHGKSAKNKQFECLFCENACF